MTILSRWTTEMVEQMPRVEGERYEIIAGELYVTTAPHYRHQSVCTNLIVELGNWSRLAGAGLTLPSPGVVFAEDEAVIPDLVWVRRDRLEAVLGEDGHLHAAPDLVIEVISPGKANEERDREKRLDLYSRRGVAEYWIVDWQGETVDVHRPEGGRLRIVASPGPDDQVTSPLLPGFACPVARIFEL